MRLCVGVEVGAALVLAIGASDMVSVVIRGSLLQPSRPDAMRGRVSAANSASSGASNQLGEFESGVTAAWFGAVPAVVIGGAAGRTAPVESTLRRRGPGVAPALAPPHGRKPQ